MGKENDQLYATRTSSSMNHQGNGPINTALAGI